MISVLQVYVGRDVALLVNDYYDTDGPRCAKCGTLTNHTCAKCESGCCKKCGSAYGNYISDDRLCIKHQVECGHNRPKFLTLLCRGPKCNATRTICPQCSDRSGRSYDRPFWVCDTCEMNRCINCNKLTGKDIQLDQCGMTFCYDCFFDSCCIHCGIHISSRVDNLCFFCPACKVYRHCHWDGLCLLCQTPVET
jgi:hypothetical protein